MISPGFRLGLDRRTFLTLGATGAAAACFPSLAWGGENLASPLSVGYLAGSEDLEAFRPLPWRQRVLTAAGSLELPSLGVEPAAERLSGDQNLATGWVRVTMHGMYPRVPRRRDGLAAGADLTVWYPRLDPLRGWVREPFYAWSYRVTPQRWGSPPLKFYAPLDEAGGLPMTLDVKAPVATPGLPKKGAASAEAQRLSTQFTVDWQPGLPRLSRGLYFLALQPDVWARTRRLPGVESPEAVALTSLVMSVEPAPDFE